MKEINLDNISLIQADIIDEEYKVNKKDIAIIGMSGRIGSCQKLERFWEELVQGKYQINKLSKERASDNVDILKVQGGTGDECKFYEAAFMDDIDKFDYEFFGFSPKEASLLNPHQRLILENVWSTIEDAGYGGGQLRGSNTGVFLGLMSDAGDDYRDYALKTNETMVGITSVGNMNSIASGRISYQFDLKGPSMTIDTACSSGLTAVHLACRAIRFGDCDLAVVGSVKIDIVPVDNGNTDIDIMSSDSRTRTFDDNADGTSRGEGVCSILLKSYAKALEDGDQIYAIIKGSALNQDGSSIGLTAPNSIAQEEVITRAWADAGIAPDTIAYIEAHGTGTKLGDSVEISAIDKAFSRYTNKKQFCAIASLKSNIGHLNQASGVASLIKVVLAMKHQMIPPTINFNRPNRKIDFINSPVYVNDCCLKWKTEGCPRRAGVSAFGLSGTNCHLIIEEAPKKIKETLKYNDENYILVLSAQYEKGIRVLVREYIELLNYHAEIDLANMCITANTGRGHYTFRLAILFTDVDDLKCKLSNIVWKSDLEDITIKGIYYGIHKSSYKENENDEKYSKDTIKATSNLIQKKINQNREVDWNLLEEIAIAYVGGADINWSELYRGKQYQRISLPTYPFQKNRCWVESAEEEKEEYRMRESNHPLLDYCVVDSIYNTIYKTKFSVSRHWILSEHKVNGLYTVPGVSYIEMAGEIGKIHFGCGSWKIQELVFIHPLVVDAQMDKEVHTVIQKHNDYFKFTIASKDKEQWIKHAEGKFTPLKEVEASYFNILEIKRKCNKKKAVQYTYDETDMVDVGPRWNVIEKLQTGDNEVLVHLNLPEKYNHDMNEYFIHPTLMDCAMNAAINLIGKGLYLPWRYKSIEVYSQITKECYSYLRRKERGDANAEVATFDIVVVDNSGKVLIEVTDYTIKKVRNAHQKSEKMAKKTESFYQLGWIKKGLKQGEEVSKKGIILVFKSEDDKSSSLIREFKKQGRRIIEVSIGEEYKKIDENTYIVASNERSYMKLITNFHEEKISYILHLLNFNMHDSETIEQFNRGKLTGVMSLYYLTRALLFNRFRQKVDIVLVGNQANEVTKRETIINPQVAALFGLAKVVRQEYPKLQCRSIDIDSNTEVEDILCEVVYGEECNLVAYREGERYVEELQKLDIENVSKRDVKIRSNGVYVITGGTGDIGLEFGKYIAGKNKVHLALLNRSKFPERQNWKEILEHNEDIKLIRKIQSIQEMESSGAEVSCYSVDVSDENTLKDVFEELHQKYGKINGIIHSAGVAGDGLLITKDENVFQSVLRPKMDGTWMLDHFTKQDDLDFFILFSSISSLFGGVGQGDYTAANTYLDAYAVYRSKKGRPTLCINWPAWKDIGMAVDYGVNQDGVFKAISTEDAIQGFENIFYKDICNIFIGKLNQEYIEEFPVKISEELQIITKKSNAKDNRKDIKQKNNNIITLSGNHNNQYNDIEQKIATIWARVLGVSSIDVHASFYRLGGNSVLAVSLYRELEKEFTKMLDITDIYSYPTISQMSEYLKTKNINIMQEETSYDESNLDMILEKLANGEITEEQIDYLV